MAIASLRLQNFRSYADESFEFEPGVNIVVGPNAAGKTNLVEAILVLARGGSYKAKDVDLIKFGQPWARLDGYFKKGIRTLKLDLQGASLQKEFVLEDKPYKRLSLERTVPVVFFEPNHLQLITRGPSQRREFIDDLLQRIEPGFKTLSNHYLRALAQRNTLLKQNPARARSQLFAWDIRLSELGGKIVNSRVSLIEKINKNLSKVYSNIAHHKSKATIGYDTPFPLDNYSSKLLSKLESSAATDFGRGFTAYGPHREDILFYLNAQPIASSASRGETRSLLLALKIYELDLLEKARTSVNRAVHGAEKPIFLLDDVFSELDGKRRRALVEYLKDHQTIITTTDADAVLEYFAGHHNLIAL